MRGATSNLVGGLGIDATGGGQRIGAGLDAAVGGGEEDEALGADVAGCAVADAAGGDEVGQALGKFAVSVVAETEMGGAVELDFDDEVGVGGAAFEQVRFGCPDFGVALEGAGEGDLRDRLVCVVAA